MRDPQSSESPELQMRRLTRRSLIVGGATGLAAIGGWWSLTHSREEDGVPWPLRRALRFNERVAQSLGSSNRLVPTFPESRVINPARTNGMVGLDEEVDVADWTLSVQYPGREDRIVALRDVKKLPRFDLITEMKCVEGWSEVVHFGGASFLDFIKRFKLGTRSGQAPDPVNNPKDIYPYVYLATPDEDYYVGLDIASALHPQTMLCDEMNRRPLTQEHGAPLRLYLAVKYGYKSLKRIGIIRFQDERPRDYWADRGYDWYAGL